MVTQQSANEPPSTSFSNFGPDFTFAFEDWLRHPAGLGQIPAAAHGTEVAIVGAGIAGLVAGYELMKLGLKPVFYEPGRIGGRLRSEAFSAGQGTVADLGGMRFPSSGTAFYHYVNLLNLETKPFPNPLTDAAGSTVIDLAGEPHYAESLRDLPPLFQEVAQAWDASVDNEAGLHTIQAAMRTRDVAVIKQRWNQLVHSWDNRTFYDFIATVEPFASLSFRHREVFGQVGFGTGGWDADFRNSMLEILRVVLANFEEDQHLIVGGADQLPRQLWGHQPDELAHWPTGTSLSSLNSGATRPGAAAISRVDDGFCVTDQLGVKRTHAAALTTCQSWLLTTSIDVQEDLFSQPLWMALDRTTYTQSSKTFVMVDRPFWRDRDPETGQEVMSMTLTDRNTRGTYLLENGPDEPAVILLTYAWMSDALKVLPLSKERRVELALETLGKIYPNVDIASHIIGEAITVSWEADPHFQGAFKGALPGHYRYNHRMYGHFMQDDLPPEQRGIFLAGDDISWTPGWAEGAVQTALNAVWGITRHFGGDCHADNPGPGQLYPACGPLDLDEG